MKIFVAFLLIFSFLLLVACKEYKKNSSHQQVSNSSIKEGKKLAIQYCGSCHLLPDPALLDTKSWGTGVLPEMGPRLGIFYYGNEVYPSSRRDPYIGEKYYPSQPVVSFVQWQNIIDYYTATSPDSLLPARKPVAITINEKLFQVKPSFFTYPAPATSLIKMIQGNKLIVSDVTRHKIFVFDKDLHITDSIKIRGAVTDIAEDSGKFVLCNTGILNPNNGRYGSLMNIHSNHQLDTDILFKDLMRPVQITKADINKDGKEDYVVCEFGNLLGALSWLEKKDTNFVRHVIRPVPGSIRSYVNDYNGDGLPDIWALFSQGDEGVFLCTNKGNGVFDIKNILKFPSCYGSSYFELDDFNKDGFPDIVYTCGDNADFSPVLKPYHGMYIFLNDGKYNFSQKYFYPINGCYKAIARDFDNDGDLDIATIAFFADYKIQPEEGFVYFKNNGDFKFTPYSFEAVKYGRWLTMDAADFDGDGKIDIALGNFSIRDPVFKASVDWKQQPPFLLLKNIQ